MLPQAMSHVRWGCGRKVGPWLVRLGGGVQAMSHVRHGAAGDVSWAKIAGVVHAEPHGLLTRHDRLCGTHRQTDSIMRRCLRQADSSHYLRVGCLTNTCFRRDCLSAQLYRFGVPVKRELADQNRCSVKPNQSTCTFTDVTQTLPRNGLPSVRAAVFCCTALH